MITYFSTRVSGKWVSIARRFFSAILPVSLRQVCTGGIYAAPTVPRIISAYKASVSREAGFAVWQRSFYDHIIRNRSDFEQIWQYIDKNPLNWLLQGKTGTPDTNDVF